MDLQSFLRLKSLFGAGANLAQPGLDTSNLDPSANMPSVDNTPDDSTNQDLLSQFTPRHDITDQYTQSLTNMPQRPVPGGLRRVGAAIAGLGAGSSPQGISGGQPIGFKFNPAAADLASDKVNYPDYDNQLQDWMNKTKALGAGATEEDRANLNESRRLAGNADREIKQQAVEIKLKQVAINEKKENDIYETKKREGLDKITQADKVLAMRQKELELKGKTLETQAAWHQAATAAAQARTEMERIEHEHKITVIGLNHEKEMAALEQKNLPKYTNTQVTYDDQNRPISRSSTTGPIRGNVRMGRMVNGQEQIVDVPENKVQDFIDNYGGYRKNE